MSSTQKCKFEGFERTDKVYSVVKGHEIWTSILIPRKLVEKRENGAGIVIPVLVFWHGGGFIVGDRMYEPWWSDWLLELALSQNALIVAPDYRLLPEASGADIMDDMDAFWSWFSDTLPGATEFKLWGVSPDFDRILCVGQSAGSTIALHSALQRHDVAVKAIVSLYGPLYGDVPEFKMARPRKIIGSYPPPPRQAATKIRSYMQRTRGTIRTSGDPVEMWELVACILQQGWIPRLVNARPDSRLDSVAELDRIKTLPPIWLIHGEQDSVVPVACSTEFVKCMDEIVPDVPKLLSVVDGDHSFDVALTMQVDWIADGCNFILKYW